MLSARALGPLELLGVPVRIRCGDPECRERLALCYAAAPALAAPGSSALEADLEDVGEGAFRVRVEGREPLAARGRTEAVRALNHELMHGVMLRSPGLFFVHAGVVALGERAVVLPGLSRSGKSTLVLALVQAGARFLSDELLAFDPRERVALAFPRALKIRDLCVPYFPAFEGAWRGTGEGRFLPFAALPADVMGGPTPIGAVVIPRWSDAPPEGVTINRCAPISRGQALLELGTSALNFGTHRAASLDRLAEIVARARCARLCWDDPAAAARSIVETLEGDAP